MPSLKKNRNAFVLEVKEKPFLILGGELGNSSASSLEYMERIWPRLVQMNLNTVLVPVYWELMEPQEASFDFTLIDTLIKDARRVGLHLVLLWFGSWKNSMSCYTPRWIKEKPQKYPRARRKDGTPLEILSAFSRNNLEADIRAFTALMEHLQSFDGQEETVIMVQVENEVAMVEQPRDYSEEANRIFAAPVPGNLLEYLQEHRTSLPPNLKKSVGATGSWEEVFGAGPEGDEVFTAWSYACYVNEVAAAGRKVCGLPLFMNAALNRQGQGPGEYPSGGPLPHLLEIWQASAPEIDFFAPDIYFPEFQTWCNAYHRPENPLFVPEATLNQESAVNALYAIGRHEALGYCPFSIESADEGTGTALAGCYSILRQLTPLINQYRGTGQIAAIRLDMESPSETIRLGNYRLTCGHTHSLPWSPLKEEAHWPVVGVLIIALGPREFIAAGSGVFITFESETPGEMVGIIQAEEGEFMEERWVAGRRMNGDEDHQGRHLRLEYGQWGIQKIELYHYR